MRIYILFLFLIANLSVSLAQNVGIGTNNPHSSAELDVNSNKRGLLPPRLSMSERDSIENPADGLMIYCTDCDTSGQPQYFNGERWCNMLGGAASSILVANLPSVNIGGQIWSSVNLDVVSYQNGDPIPQVTDPVQWSNLTTGAWCWYNNDSATYATTYGRLYNWYALNDPRGLAPRGWHIPTNSEWDILTKFLDPTVDTTIAGYTGTTIGNQLKTTTGWFNSGNGNDNYGFSALPGGNRNAIGTFEFVGSFGFWWNASSYDVTRSWYRYLDYGYSDMLRYYNNKSNGFSVRVVKN